MGKQRKNPFKALDQFAPEVSLTFEGRTKFKTINGAIATLVVFGLIASYASIGFVRVVSGEIESITTQQLFTNLGQEGLAGLKATELGFKFAVGILGEELDPTYATLKAQYVQY